MKGWDDEGVGMNPSDPSRGKPSFKLGSPGSVGDVFFWACRIDLGKVTAYIYAGLIFCRSTI